MKRHMILATNLLVLALAALNSGIGLSPTLADSAQSKVENLATATFVVEHMTCGTCPITVKTAMSRVAGVRSVAIDFDAKTATVVFDPALASPEAIAAASTNAGYPARLAAQRYSR